MARGRRYLILFLLATGILWAGGTVEQDRLVFPRPDRPVAAIVSPAYSDEKTRDSNGEAERVMDGLGIRPGLRVADIGAGRVIMRYGSRGVLVLQPPSMLRTSTRIILSGSR